MNTLQVLIDAKKLIEKPDSWWPGRPRAEEWPPHQHCAMSAVGAAQYRHRWNCPEALDALALAAGLEADRDIVQFNDTHSHADVLLMFDRAIEAERAKVQQ
jgi:hypothetical protein